MSDSVNLVSDIMYCCSDVKNFKTNFCVSTFKQAFLLTLFS